jgi:hypothetical protein
MVDILDKLDKTLNTVSKHHGVQNAKELVDIFKNNFRSKLDDKFLKVDFDNDDDYGAIFVRYAKTSYNEATNQAINDCSTNFIIAIDGFDANGDFDENDNFSVETLSFKDEDKKVRRLSRKKFSDINLAKQYVTKYFESNIETFNENVTCAGGTTSGATSTADGGSDNTNGSIAVKKEKLTKKIQRR